MSARSTDDSEAFADHARRKAGAEFGEVIRRNTPEYGRSFNEDAQAYADDEIRRAAQKFYEDTKSNYDWPSR